jgi:hypothetical protein
VFCDLDGVLVDFNRGFQDIEENTENVGYGDWYETSENIFYRPLTTPPDFPPQL